MNRTVVATVLAVLGCLLAGPAVAAFALDHEITDQGRYLAAVGPLAEDPVVRRAIADHERACERIIDTAPSPSLRGDGRSASPSLRGGAVTG